MNHHTLMYAEVDRLMLKLEAMQKDDGPLPPAYREDMRTLALLLIAIRLEALDTIAQRASET